jgi:hypothetical protein
MALSPTAAWYEGCDRADTALRFFMQIYDGTTTWSAVDGPCDQLDYPQSILDVTPITSEVDPILRETQISGLEITVEDEWLRTILVSNRIKGQKVTVEIGAQEIAESDFLGYFLGVIQDTIPDGRKQTVRLIVDDAFSLAAGQAVQGYWVGIHGLEVLDDILTTKLTDAVDANLVDTTSLDPSDAAHSTISHWVVSRGGRTDYNNETGVWRPTPARELINDLSQLLYGNFVANETGVVGFKKFDSTDAATFNWTTDEIISMRQLTVDDNAVNRVEISAWPDATGKATKTIYLGDTASQGNLAYPGKTERVEALQIETLWVTEYSFLESNYNAASVAAFNLKQGFQFSGSNQWDTGPQPAWAQASGTKPIFLLIDDEIIKAESLTFGTSDESVQEIQDPETGLYIPLSTPTIQTVDDVTRGYAGSTDANHLADARVYDATVLVALGEAILDRAAHGISIIEVVTNFGEFENQIGDIGTVTHTAYLAYGKDGITSSDKWEIISKSASKAENRITWKLAAAGTTAATLEGGGRQWGVEETTNVAADETLENDNFQHGFIPGDDDLVVADDGGLAVAVATGVATSPMANTERTASTSLTCQATMDTYVGLDVRTNQVFQNAVAIDAAEPASTSSTIWLAKVTTGAAAIDSITDLRPRTGLDGVNLDQSTVGVHQSLGADQRSTINRNSHFLQYTRG